MRRRWIKSNESSPNQKQYIQFPQKISQHWEPNSNRQVDADIPQDCLRRCIRSHAWALKDPSTMLPLGSRSRVLPWALLGATCACACAAAKGASVSPLDGATCCLHRTRAPAEDPQRRYPFALCSGFSIPSSLSLWCKRGRALMAEISRRWDRPARFSIYSKFTSYNINMSHFTYGAKC